MTRPIVVDIDGTLSRPDRSIEGRVIDAIREWPATVVVATGKAFPYPVALCDFIGRDHLVIAENGGVVFAGDQVHFEGDPEACERFAAALRDRGYDLGWGHSDVVNRWRETEVAVVRDVPRDVVDELAREHGLQVIDSGFAYHITAPAVSKGRAFRTLCEIIGRDPSEFGAIGDSENDVSTFEVVGDSFAVANADDRALGAADHVTDGTHGDGLLEALEAWR
ncbi:MAG: phosphoglycolate phosphatase [Halobacteriales archaeon]